MPDLKLKILFLTTPLYDYLADAALIGLREIYGENCVEYPRKAIMYGDIPCVYGRGFTIWTKPLADVPRGSAAFEEVDVVVYSNFRRQSGIDWRLLVKNRRHAPRVVYVDGNDDNNVDPQIRPFFKRELAEPQAGVFPVHFAIPDRHVRPIDLLQKTQLHQTHVQDPEFGVDTGYKFTEEKDYFDDLARSYFGITMRKGGWDCMRHYEIMAAGAVVMFKHFDQKPPLCAPQCPHFISYSSREDFMEKTRRLLPDGKPGPEYIRILNAQREWLLANATCQTLAKQLMDQSQAYFAGKECEPMPRVTFKLFRKIGLKWHVVLESAKLRAITFVKLNPSVDWFYYRVFKKIPGVQWFVSKVLMREKPDQPSKPAVN
jgi:hypothetical protein